MTWCPVSVAGNSLRGAAIAVVVAALALHAPPVATAAGLGIERAPAKPGLDRSIRKISLSQYVTRTHNLAPICVQSKRVLFMNVRYADLDGDNAEEAVMEAVTCRSADGTPDVTGVLSYQHPDSVRELPTEHSKPGDDPIFAGRIGPIRLELIDGRLVRWFALDAGTCPSGKPRPPGRRSIVYRWSGTLFVVDRVNDTRPSGGC
jgi:hypothetical protein